MNVSSSWVVAAAFALAAWGCGDDAGVAVSGDTVVAITDTRTDAAADAGTDAAADVGADAAADVGADAAADVGADAAADVGADAAADVGADTESGMDTETGAADTATDTTSPSCDDTPNPFVPVGPTAAWEHSIATPIARAAGAANHRGQDVVVAAGQPQLLIGKFAYGFIDKDLKDEDVEVWLQREPPCGAWELLATVRTSEDGEYGTQYGIADDGGRVFYPIPDDQALPVGRYPIRMLVRGDHSVAAFDLVVVAPGTQAVVFDIDGTLTTDDTELIMEIAQSIFAGTYDQAMRAAAVETTRAWYDHGYLVIYLTGRPDLLRPMTERWIEAHGFPPGPIHLTDTNGQVLPTNGGVGDYKTAYLASLAGAVSVYAAYGNATTDIYAFANAGIPLERTFIAGPHGGEAGTVAVGDDFQAHLPAAQAMPAASAPAPPAHGWW